MLWVQIDETLFYLLIPISVIIVCIILICKLRTKPVRLIAAVGGLIADQALPTTTSQSTGTVDTGLQGGESGGKTDDEIEPAAPSAAIVTVALVHATAQITAFNAFSKASELFFGPPMPSVVLVTFQEVVYGLNLALFLVTGRRFRQEFVRLFTCNRAKRENLVSNGGRRIADTEMHTLLE